MLRTLETSILSSAEKRVAWCEDLEGNPGWGLGFCNKTGSQRAATQTLYDCSWGQQLYFLWFLFRSIQEPKAAWISVVPCSNLPFHFSQLVINCFYSASAPSIWK